MFTSSYYLPKQEVSRNVIVGYFIVIVVNDYQLTLMVIHYIVT